MCQLENRPLIVPRGAARRHNNYIKQRTSMTDLDLTPIFDLFHQLPEGTGKVVLGFALAMGFGALLAVKAPSAPNRDFIWWD